MSITVFCNNLIKNFGALRVVDSVSFSVASGHILALLGPSGCGKTTTLRLMAGFEQLDAGEIVIEGQTVANGRLHLPPEQRRAGMVFQDYAIFPHLSVRDNVQFGLGRGKAAREQAADMLAFVGLANEGGKMPHELSGGQQQRVALARALAPKPAVLLLDEPFSNLDAALRATVRSEVRDLLKRSGTTAVFVTHDQEEALFVGDEVAVMRAGRLEQIGTPEQIFHKPRTRFVAEFVGETDFLPGKTTSAGVATPLGTVPRQTNLPDDTAVSIMLRADDVLLTPDDDGNGRIVDRRFVGIAFVYTVALADGTRLHSWQHHTTYFAPGTAVRATLSAAHDLTIFHHNQAI